MSDDDVSAFLPMSPAVFHVMVSLADGDRHGYAIIKRLLADGLIVEVSARRAIENDSERRRYYRLTAFGRRVAVAEAERLERSVAAARASKLLSRLRSA